MSGTMKMFNYSRTSTLILLPKLEEKYWDIQPEGFPNTIRWNAGHVYAEADAFLKDADKNYEVTRPHYQTFFADGTRPSEWVGDVPTKEEIIEALIEQDKYIQAFFKDKLNEDADVVRDINKTLLDTKDASLQFVTWHEGIHLGITKSIRDALKEKNE
ncbi:MAG TPA: DinB family protein [Pseudogracilibacillus sp.]|nr:DinB family protein [Pseudogracilibacillus sp.]